MKINIRISRKALGVAVGAIATAAMLIMLCLSSGNTGPSAETSGKDLALMDRFDMYVHNTRSSALEGVMAIDKVYWLSDDDLIAPEPDQSKYGRTKDPTTLGWLLEEASDLLDGQETVFNTDIKIARGTEVIYYLDETIFAVTWKQAIDAGMYTFSEVKIAHPSQLRRFLSGGAYGSETRMVTTQMAKTVNAVVASSGDFYGFRRHGVIVYDGQVKRCNDDWVHTCYIDENGDLLFTYAGEFGDVESAQAFVDENKIRFSMAFGPVLVDHGEKPRLGGYLLGEVDDRYPRAALCQMDDLHYVVTTVNAERGYGRTATIYSFAKVIYGLEPEMAYTLDGGQTAVIAMNDKMINAVLFGSQRPITDIFYFATAVPDGS